MTCQVCGGLRNTVLLKEQNVSCGDYFEGRRLYPDNVGYQSLMECIECGFAQFDDMSAWSEARFADLIYNDDYHLCDMPFEEIRPRRLADWLSSFVGDKRLVDYGGGKGRMAEILGEHGHYATSYDPFYGMPFPASADADIVTAFEVVEHIPDSRSAFRSMQGMMKDSGIIVFSTLTKPTKLRGDWWYASPRNGHVSLHTEESLSLTLAQVGMEMVSLSREVHVAARDASLLEECHSWPMMLVNETVRHAFGDGWDDMVGVTAPLRIRELVE